MSLIDNLLQKTSRTFALSIPLLPDSLQHSVGVAYLLFRIVDTIEDELPCSIEERKRALLTIADRFEEDPRILREVLGKLEFNSQSIQNGGYTELLDCTSLLVEAYETLDTTERSPIGFHLVRTCRGMASYLGRDLSGGSIEDLKEYCYIVAGIVGEMLTDLFVAHDEHLRPILDALREDSTAFGEGLQLVNIIRDSADDVHAGRCYLPRSIDRASLIDIARLNLSGAESYVMNLQNGESDIGIVRFNALNLALAQATIDAVEKDGPGAKLTRSQVEDIFTSISNSSAPLNTA